VWCMKVVDGLAIGSASWAWLLVDDCPIMWLAGSSVGSMSSRFAWLPKSGIVRYMQRKVVSVHDQANLR
jgi:hypothetical protein